MFDSLREPVVIGNVKLSVQASSDHYCTPRVDGLDLDQYERVEVAILQDGKMTTPCKLALSRAVDIDMPEWNEITRIDSLFEDGNSPVAGYVPIQDVQKLRDFIQKWA